MRVFCLYRPNTEQERPIEELNHELVRRINKTLELVSMDTKDGVRLAELYGAMVFPTIIATDSNGVLQHIWDNGTLPLINELTYYLDA